MQYMSGKMKKRTAADIAERKKKIQFSFYSLVFLRRRGETIRTTIARRIANDSRGS
jgi:hypothetical protein